ncbi:MAG: acyl carrier protein [Acutalibacteraceae bacterium]
MFDKLVEILGRYTDVKNISITEDTLILRDLGLNSYALTELAGDIEDEFGIEFSDSALMQVKTVGDVMRYVEENR